MTGEFKLRDYEWDTNGRAYSVLSRFVECPKGPKPQGNDEYGSSIRCQSCGGHGGHQLIYQRKRERAPEYDAPRPVLPGDQAKLF